jgi:hypothetical protein
VLLKRQIPVRTFNDWNETQPRFFEGDLVAHCGPIVHGYGCGHVATYNLEKRFLLRGINDKNDCSACIFQLWAVGVN